MNNNALLNQSVFFKMKIFLRAIRIIKNWHVYLLLYFGLLREDPIIVFRNNLKVKMRAKSTDFYVLTNVWIIGEYDLDKLQIKNSDTVIDIGAHVGFFTVYVSQICVNGKIYSYEPIKENYELLAYNLSINNIKNTTIFQKAVTDKSGSVRIFLNSDSAAHSVFSKSDRYTDTESVSLKEIFDSNKIEKCDVLKLDCEGSEYMILNSLPESYFKRIQKIVMEYHRTDEEPNLLQDLIKKLKLLNYQIEIRKNTSDYGIMFAIKE